MSELDITSILVAAGLGAAILTVVDQALNTTVFKDLNSIPQSVATDLLFGALVGASVQIGVRLIGVS